MDLYLQGTLCLLAFFPDAPQLYAHPRIWAQPTPSACQSFSLLSALVNSSLMHLPKYLIVILRLPEPLCLEPETSHDLPTSHNAVIICIQELGCDYVLLVDDVLFKCQCLYSHYLESE